MTADEFEALLKRDRSRAIEVFCETWLDANSESHRDTIKSLAALATYEGTPRLVIGEDDRDIVDNFYEMVGDADDEGDANPKSNLTAADRQAAYEATGFGPDDMDDDQIERYVAQHEEDPLDVMEEALRNKEKIFEYTGGRGIELADEIDALRIAIAIRRARGGT